MKKWFAAMAAGIVLAAVSGIWLASEMGQEEITLQEYKITFIAPMANSGYWGNAAGGVLDTGEQYNINVKCVGFSELNLEKQVYAIENAVLSGADGIITAAYEDSAELREAVRKAREADIPVIFIDSDVEDIGRLCYIGSDNFAAGKTAGAMLAEKCGGQAQVAVITSYSSNANQTERIAGFMEALEDYPEMKVVSVLEGQSKIALLKERVMSMLEEQPGTNAIFCAEGYASSSICYLLQENKEKFSNIKIITFDSTQSKAALGRKELAAIINQDPYEMGRQAVEVLWEYFSGNRTDIEDRYIDVQIAEQEDAGIDEYKTREDILWHIY